MNYKRKTRRKKSRKLGWIPWSKERKIRLEKEAEKELLDARKVGVLIGLENRDGS